MTGGESWLAGSGVRCCSVCRRSLFRSFVPSFVRSFLRSFVPSIAFVVVVVAAVVTLFCQQGWGQSVVRWMNVRGAPLPDALIKILATCLCA